jgi:hypothetical protein
METIALVGAAGKMGGRLSERLKESPNYRVLYVESGEGGAAKLRARGDEPTPTDAALAQADYVILAVPDTLIGTIAGEIVPQVRPGTMVICLDPAAPYAGKLPEREDVTYFITHPAHPPVFKDEDDPEARRDFFGAGKAKQAIVNALMQGPEEDYARGEEIGHVIWGPVLRSHRVTVEQMAYLEPLLSETIAQTAVVIVREAVDEAARRGVPYEAARDFVLGHLGIQIAIFFDEIDWQISDGAKMILRVAKDQIMHPEWKRVFEPEEVKKSCLQIVGDLPVPPAS